MLGQTSGWCHSPVSRKGVKGTYQKEWNLCRDCPAGWADNRAYKTNKCQTACKVGKYSTAKSATCTDCPEGFLNTVEKSGRCTFCPAGKKQTKSVSGHGWGETTTYSCDKCTSGKYQNEPKKDVCIACEAGYYQDQSLPDGNTECKECPLGWYDAANVDLGGSVNEGRTSCTECDAGMITTGTASTDCSSCPPGKKSTGEACSDCPGGRYQPEEGEDFCSECEAGTFWPGGASSITVAFPGFTINGISTDDGHDGQSVKVEGGVANKDACITECEDAPACGCIIMNADHTQCWGRSDCEVDDLVSDNQKNVYFLFRAGVGCIDCPVGYSQPSDDKDKCNDCDRGSFSDEPGLDECKVCGVGRFTNVLNAEECHACPNGRYTDVEETNECKSCPEGWSRQNSGDLAEVTRTCNACETGTYTDDIEEELCTECPVGYFGATRESSECAVCPVATYAKSTVATGLESFAAACAVCAEGQYTPEASPNMQCTACPIKTYLSYSESFDAPSGRWEVESCLDCPNDNSGDTGVKTCDGCGSGQFGPNSGNCQNCQKGQYAGGGFAACVVCPSGFHGNDVGGASGGASKCVACPAGTYREHPEAEKNTDCTSCDAGKYGEAEAAVAATACKNCVAGKYILPKIPPNYNNHVALCLECPPGRRSNTAGRSTECQECPKGRYLDSPAS